MPVFSLIAIKRLKTEETRKKCVINQYRFNECYRYHTNSEGKDIILGKGGFGTVHEGVSIQSPQEHYAIKYMEEQLYPRHDEVYQEVAILQQLYHPNIIHLYDFFDEEDFYYLVMEKVAGGELFDRIGEKKHRYNESEARDACKMILHALWYMYNKGIVHRDLKPENLLLVDKGNDSVIKIADFGALLRLIDVTLAILTHCSNGISCYNINV